MIGDKVKNIDDIYEQKLEKLLNCKLENNNYDFKNTQFILFGAGNLGVRTLDGLNKIGIKPFALGDNDSKKLDTEIKGLKVLSKARIMEEYGENILIVLSVWGASLSKEARVSILINSLKEYGFQNVIDITQLYNNYPSIFLPHYCIDLPENIQKEKENIIKACRLLEDSDSKNEYYEQVKWRLLHDNWEKFVDVDFTPYFQKDIYNLKYDDVIFDCGSFDGDTIRELLKQEGKFKKIIAFEPDKGNYNKLVDFVSKKDEAIKNKIETFEYAIGDKEEILLFEECGNASSTISNNGSCEVRSISIDSFVKHNPQNIPTIIKMDIEGFEELALIGAKKTIREYQTVLLISVYHKPRDLWEILLLVNDICDDYKFYLRHHTGDCWDTVLYAIPKQR